MKFIIILSMLLLCASISFAADSPSYNVRAAGDLKVDGTLYLNDGSPIISSNGLLKNRGLFIPAPATPYFAGDVVQFNGNSYVCILANSSVIPTVTANWSLLAAQGAQGIKGDKGDTGLQGIKGDTGSNGLNTLLLLTTEASGANCVYGGVKVQVGLDSNSNAILDVGEINQTQTKFVCNGISTLSNNSGTYSGYQSGIMGEGGTFVETISIILSQSGTTISGTFSTSTGAAGTITGILNGNIYSFSNTFTKVSQGCTSSQASGVGSLQNNKLTYFISGSNECGATYHFSGSGVLTKQ